MNLPPYLSRTPPPLENDETENEDEEFGNFVVCSDLGEEGFEGLEKDGLGALRGEDNVSEDSGFCMNSCGQTQSPCDISPLSSSYPNKANECEVEDVSQQTTSVLHENDSPAKETLQSYESSFVISDEPFKDNTLSTEINIPKENLTSPSFEPLVLPSSSNTFPYLSDSARTLIPQKCDDQSGNVNEVVISSDEPTLERDKEPSDIEFHFAEDHTQWFSDFENSCDFTRTTEKEFVSESNLGIQLSEASLDLKNYGTVSNEVPFDPFESMEGAVECRNDDDFSDFAEFQSSEVHGSEVFDANPEAVTPQYLESDIFKEEDPESEVSVNPLSSILLTSSVWKYLQSFEGTPAFKYQWALSSSNMKFLQALRIDSRNILHGPWSKASKFSVGDMPPQSDTSFHIPLLDPAGSTCFIPTSSKAESVPDAHFDWLNSGLTDPLQSSSDTKVHLSDTKPKKHSGADDKLVSEVLSSLPSLSYVKSQYLAYTK